MSDTVFYVLSAVLSVAVLLGIHWMSKVETAVRGNRLSALAMLCAIILTFIKHDLLGIPDIWIGLAAGSLISVVIAKRTRMIAMPQLVGLLNGLGGLASAGAAILTLGFGRNIGTFELVTALLGMAVGAFTFSGSVVAAGKLHRLFPQKPVIFPAHRLLLAASIMAAPATLVVAKLLVPETGTPLTRGTVKMEVEKTTSNVIDAAAAGAGDGLRLALNIGAMLLAFIALIALVDAPLKWFGEVTGIASWLGQPTSLATLLGYLLAPIAWVIGTPWEDATVVGSLIGQKVVINEFIAYTQLASILNGQVPNVALSPQGALIATYALCGFANFSSIAIQIGGIGGLAPERRSDLARFGLRAVLGGTIATLMTATIAGVLSHFG